MNTRIVFSGVLWFASAALPVGLRAQATTDNPEHHGPAGYCEADPCKDQEGRSENCSPFHQEAARATVSCGGGKHRLRRT